VKVFEIVIFPTRRLLTANRLHFVTSRRRKKELKPIKAQLTNIEEKLDRISLRTHQDDTATLKDVDKLTLRVSALEETIAKLKLGYDA
jgi:hypothetical protein